MNNLSDELEFFLLRDGVIERTTDEFIIDPHQVFPSRYLAPHRGNRTLLVNYSMGTGKSLSASLVIFPIMERIDYLRSCSKSSEILPKPYIIGNWSTIEAFEEELLRPQFKIVS